MGGRGLRELGMAEGIVEHSLTCYPPFWRCFASSELHLLVTLCQVHHCTQCALRATKQSKACALWCQLRCLSHVCLGIDVYTKAMLPYVVPGRALLRCIASAGLAVRYDCTGAGTAAVLPTPAAMLMCMLSAHATYTEMFTTLCLHLQVCQLPAASCNTAHAVVPRSI